MNLGICNACGADYCKKCSTAKQDDKFCSKDCENGIVDDDEIAGNGR